MLGLASLAKALGGALLRECTLQIGLDVLLLLHLDFCHILPESRLRTCKLTSVIPPRLRFAVD